MMRADAKGVTGPRQELMSSGYVNCRRVHGGLTCIVYAGGGILRRESLRKANHNSNRGVVMKFRILTLVALGVLTALIAPSGFAKGIAVDGNIYCPSTSLLSSSAGPISLGGSNSADPGVTGLPVWACADTLAGDTGAIEFFTFNSSTSLFNTWIDPSAQSTTVVESQPLSNLSGLISQVGVYQLTGLQPGYSGNLTGVTGDYEVQFNYDNYGGSPCPASHASLSWAGGKWTFTGAGGVGLCDLSSTNDFLFNSSGSLLGYLNTSGSLVAGLPPGWVKGSPISTPEPDTLALGAAAALLMLLARSRSRQLTRGLGRGLSRVWLQR
jgi:hypothetical protein